MHTQLAERLYDALRAQDPTRFRDSLDRDSTWELPGRSAIAGVHRGPDAILAMLQRLAVLRPIHHEAFDVATSDYHGVLMTRLVGDGLDSDHVVVVVAGEDGRLDRAFHYVFDAYAFDAFFQ